MYVSIQSGLKGVARSTLLLNYLLHLNSASHFTDVHHTMDVILKINFQNEIPKPLPIYTMYPGLLCLLQEYKWQKIGNSCKRHISCPFSQVQETFPSFSNKTCWKSIPGWGTRYANKQCLSIAFLTHLWGVGFGPSIHGAQIFDRPFFLPLVRSGLIKRAGNWLSVDGFTLGYFIYLFIMYANSIFLCM